MLNLSKLAYIFGKYPPKSNFLHHNFTVSLIHISRIIKFSNPSGVS
jgi:hypothetical protein